MPYPWRRCGFPQAGERFRLGRLLVREPEYRELWRKTHDVSVLEKAGFFDDELDRHQSGKLVAHWSPGHPLPWTTPLPSPSHWERVRASGKPVVVLLATGAFAPFHNGHKSMLEAAVGAARKRGLEVLATYVSPSHDSYVSGKDGGRAARYPASLRIDALRQALEADLDSSRPPFLVDPWEAQVAPKALNFTSVVRRLEHYLNAYRPADFPALGVVYVFGADNAGFSLAYEPNDDRTVKTICVGRPGHAPSPAGVFVPLENPHSSTLLRRKEGERPRKTFSERCRGVFLIRNEGAWATSHWENKVPKEALAFAWDRFAQDVRRVLEQAFEAGPDSRQRGPRPGRFAWLDLQAQRRQVQQWSQKHRVVALDPCVADLPGVVSWPHSRYFSISSHQTCPVGRGWRPGCPPLSLPDQWKKVWLVDDDISTGQSMAHASGALKEMGVEVVCQRTLTPDLDVFDVVDLRDFLPGAREAGLVVLAPSQQLVRVPYMAPFTDLTTRSRLPLGRALQSSALLWLAAARFFDSLPEPITVSDMWPSSAQAMLLQGVDSRMPLAWWCRYIASPCRIGVRWRHDQSYPFPRQNG